VGPNPTEPDSLVHHFIGLHLSNIINVHTNSYCRISCSKGVTLCQIQNGATEFSKERNGCKHVDNDVPHSHGVFTFYFIEGLDGMAADPQTGLVTIDNLRRHIENKMIAEGKQSPIIIITEPSQIASMIVQYQQLNSTTRYHS
jgi:hypothetical protein